MAIPFTCPSCGEGYLVGARFAGKTVACKACAAISTLPGVDAADETHIAIPYNPSATAATPPCPTCRAPLDPGATFCTHCGYDLQRGIHRSIHIQPRPRPAPPPTASERRA